MSRTREGGSLTRRDFVGALSALAAAGPLGAACAAGETGPAGNRLDGYGVQLYTLRSVIADDVDATLAELAAIGYASVELAGLYGLSAREMRSRLDAAGLRAASSHHSVAEVRGAWAAVLEGAQELGQELIVVPSIPGAERDAEALRRVADDFNRAGEMARSAGIRFGYHNHDWEFAALPDGTRPMDLLLERTDPAVVDWQMDIFWTVHGGADPAELLRSSAGRVTSVHVKDRSSDGRMVDVGDGVIDFGALLELGTRLGLVHAFVEHDNPGDAIESVRRSFRHLSAL